ncbi:MAG: DUF1566 domain-containing protein [Candidatus Electrothrix sp. ATG2]|nr:DUF1566 domain-containing protein [Candidatus Electrothrix sp. ATG2]
MEDTMHVALPIRNMTRNIFFFFLISLAFFFAHVNMARAEYTVVDTGQISCFGLDSEIDCPGLGDDFYGQDAQYSGNTPSYTDNGDGTVTDHHTGLQWQQTSDSNGDGSIDSSDKMNQDQAISYCQDLVLAGQDDWRLPDIKTLYSLIDFSGEDVSGQTTGAQPFLNTDFFDFGYGDTEAGERLIDAQWATTSDYVSTVMGGNPAMFGVNFADGRIKGYGPSQQFYVQCVRGDESYATNNLVDNNDGTITDQATGLMWQQEDNGAGVDWNTALTTCEDADTGGHTDWRLPNAKELHSIVEYSRSPDITSSAALDPLFSATAFTNEGGQEDYGFYWTSTTHKTANGRGGNAVYIAFGRALGYMNGQWLDVHGAGAQRSDSKEEKDISAFDPSYEQATTAQGGVAIIHGPQGDVVRMLNYVRCVRDSDENPANNGTVSMVPIYMLLLR